MINEILTFFKSPLGLVTISLMGAVAGVFLYKKFGKPSGYEGTNFKERVHDSYIDIIRKLGKAVGIKLRYGFKPLGSVYRETSFYIKGVSTEKRKAKEKVEVSAILTRPEFKPHFPFKFLFWGLTDFLLGMSCFSNLFIIPSKYINIADQVEIDKDLPLTKIGGVYVPRSEQGIDIAFEEAILGLMEDMGERFSNTIEFMNYLDMQFTKKNQLITHRAEEERKKWGAREKDAIEGD